MILKKNIFTLFKYFGIKFLGVLCSAIIIFFLQKKFGNETQGLFGVLSNSILLLTIFSNFGIPSLVSLQMAYSKKSKAKIKRIISNCLKTILIIQPFFLPLYVYQFYSITYSYLEVVLLCFVTFFNVLIYFYAFVLRGLNEYGWMIFLTDSSRSILVILAIFIFNNFIEIKSLIIYSLFFSSLVTFLLGYLKTKLLGIEVSLTLKNINLNRVKHTLFNSTSLMIASFGLLCVQQINIIQLSYYKDLEDVGFFNFTFKYLMLTVMPVSVIIAKYAHLSSELFYDNKFKELKKTLLFSSIISISLTALALIVLYFFSEVVYSFANQNFDLKLYFLIGVSMLFFSLYSFWISFLTQVKKSKQIVYILSIAIFTNLFLNYFITPEYSYYGTAFSDLVSNFVSLILCTFLIFKFFKNEINTA